MANYNLIANFNAVQPGPMTKAAKLAVWGMPASSIYSNPNPSTPSIFDADPNGQWFSIAPGGVNGGNCCRMYYPANVAGENSKYYQIQLGPVGGVPVNVEFDFMFETGFDLTQSAGKIAPLICWGGRSGAGGGAAIFATWGSATGAQNKPFNPILQNQQSPSSYPSQFISPGYNTANIQANRWYHWQYQIKGGPDGWAKHWLDGQLLSTTVTTMGNTTPNDPVMVEVGFWAGGTVANTVDSWARHDNMHIWTTTPVDTVTIQGGPMSLVAGGVAQKYQAVFKNSATNQIVTPTAQVQFASSDPTKASVTPVAGTFDQFLAVPIKANDDGSPAVVGINCILPASSMYSGYTGAASLPPVTTLTIDLVVFQPVA